MKFSIIPFFKFFDILRRIIVNLLFWGIVVIIGAVCIKNSYIPKVTEGSVLLLNPTGYIIEYTSPDTADILSGSEVRKDTTLREIIAVLNEAAIDNNISSVFLDLRRLDGSGLSKLQEIAIAIKNVRDSGKKVIAFSDTYSQAKYYLACYTENIVIDPLGEMMFKGVGGYQNYFGKGLKKFGIKVNVFRAGDYKSAVEPYISDKMSAPAREASAEYLNELWTQYLAAVTRERNITKRDIDRYISSYAVILEKNRGNSAKTAKSYNIIDTIAVYEEALALAGTGRKVNWKDYYKTITKKERPAPQRIAVVVASGPIISGKQPPGTIGASSYVSILEGIKKDQKVAAVILRIDSGGGSVAASEAIRRSLQDVKKEGKHVIVSMSSIAASGSYWISTASDSILCMPSTLTGSIGVFGMLPDISEFLEKYPGITTDGYGTTKFSSFYRPDISLTEDMKKIVTLSVENDYSTFLSFVSTSRDIQLSETRKIAGGRIWGGNAAVEIGLADDVGTLGNAIALAAQESGILDYSVDYYEPKEDLRTTISRGLKGMATSDKDTVSAKLYKLISGALPLFSGNTDNSDMIFENLFDGNQSVYMGPEYIFR
ncbi:MAG: signal peptide peptidase SppA [Spirochaetaceae bacterium]|nr:signal peptide peptidase SppA [Spirochaetaceae bacterium]